MIVLDASCLIALLDAHDLHHAEVSARLARHAAEDWAVSALTLAEVMVRPAHDSARLAEAGEHIADLDLTVVDLRDLDAEGLAEIRARTRLRMPDCCVLLAAVTTGGAIVTTDQALRREALAMGIAVLDGRGPTATG